MDTPAQRIPPMEYRRRDRRVVSSYDDVPVSFLVGMEEQGDFARDSSDCILGVCQCVLYFPNWETVICDSHLCGIDTLSTRGGVTGR